MSEKENKELIKKGYAAFSSGDVETVMDLFDDDIEWVQPGKSRDQRHLPWQGRSHGAFR